MADVSVGKVMVAETHQLLPKCAVATDTPWHVVSLSRTNSRSASRTKSRPSSAGRSTVRACTERVSDGDTESLRYLVDSVRNLDTGSYTTDRRAAFLKRSKSDTGRNEAKDAGPDILPGTISRAVEKLLANSNNECGGGSGYSGHVAARRPSLTEAQVTKGATVTRSRSLAGETAVKQWQTGSPESVSSALHSYSLQSEIQNAGLGQSAALGSSPPKHRIGAPLRSTSAVFSNERHAGTDGGGSGVPGVADLRRVALERVNSMDVTGRPNVASLSRPPLPLSRSNSRSSIGDSGPSTPTSSTSSPIAANITCGSFTAARESRLGAGVGGGVAERTTSARRTEWISSETLLASRSAGSSTDPGMALKKSNSDFTLSSAERVNGLRDVARQSQMAKLKARWAETKAKYQRAAIGWGKGRGAGLSSSKPKSTGEWGSDDGSQAAEHLQAELMSIECEMRQLSRMHS